MARKRTVTGRTGRSRRAQAARGLPRAVDGDLARHVDHGGERLHRRARDRLEDLLVGPSGLARLLVEVHGRAALALDERLEVAQQRGLALVAGVPLAGERDL